ncbi:MAG: putative quinol monooxygenase [Opitutales bacterium]
MKKILFIITSLALLLNTACVSNSAKSGTCCSASETYSKPLKRGDGSATTVVTVYVDISPEERQLFLDLYLELARNTQKEEGCLEYNIWKDFKGENTFFLYEEYADDAALAAHMNAPYFKVWEEKSAVLKTFGRHVKVYHTKLSSE